MGLAQTILILALLVALGFWGYSTLKIETITACVAPEKDRLEVTCVQAADCANYLTSLYGSYPDTQMYKFLLTEISTCNLGKCEVNKFSFDKVCKAGETPLVYKVTLQEYLASR